MYAPGLEVLTDRCPKCKSKSFHIIVERATNPLMNDEDYYCADCGEQFMLPPYAVKEDKTHCKSCGCDITELVYNANRGSCSECYAKASEYDNT